MSATSLNLESRSMRAWASTFVICSRLLLGPLDGEVGGESRRSARSSVERRDPFGGKRCSSASSSSGESSRRARALKKLIGEPGVPSEYRTVQIGAEDATGAGAIGALTVADAGHHRSE